MRTFRNEIRRIEKRYARGEMPPDMNEALELWLYARDKLRQRNRREPAPKGMRHDARST